MKNLILVIFLTFLSFSNLFSAEKIYSNGDKYIGELKNDIPHGKGTYTYSRGDKYIGEYKNGEKNGQGTYIFLNGEKVE